MAPEEIEQRVERVARVVLTELFEAVGELRRPDAVADEVEQRSAERVVHDAVEFLALEVLAQLAVAHLVGGILPDFADEKRVGLLGKNRLLDLGNEAIRELVRDVEAPAAGTSSQPGADHAVLATDELPKRRVILVEVG